MSDLLNKLASFNAKNLVEYYTLWFTALPNQFCIVNLHNEHCIEEQEDLHLFRPNLKQMTSNLKQLNLELKQLIGVLKLLTRSLKQLTSDLKLITSKLI